jgi:hypothetical protein
VSEEPSWREIHLLQGEIDLLPVGSGHVTFRCETAGTHDSDWSVEPGQRRAVWGGGHDDQGRPVPLPVVLVGHGPKPPSGSEPTPFPVPLMLLGALALAVVVWLLSAGQPGWWLLMLVVSVLLVAIVHAAIRLWGAGLSRPLALRSAWWSLLYAARRTGSAEEEQLRVDRVQTYEACAHTRPQTEKRRKLGRRLDDLDRALQTGSQQRRVQERRTRSWTVSAAALAWVVLIGFAFPAADMEPTELAVDDQQPSADGSVNFGESVSSGSKGAGGVGRGGGGAGRSGGEDACRLDPMPDNSCPVETRPGVDLQLLGSVESVLGLVNHVAGAAASTKRQAEDRLAKLIDEIGMPTLKSVVQRAADEALDRVFSSSSVDDEVSWQLEFVVTLQQQLLIDPELGPLYALRVSMR